MIKIFKSLGLILLVVLVGVVIAKNIVVKTAIEQGVKKVTGLPLVMEKLDISFTKTYVRIVGLQVFNPAGFSDKTMLDMPEIYVDYDLGSILKKKIHLSEIRIDMKEFVVVKNADGKLNLDSLTALQKAGVSAPQEGKKEEKKPAAKMPEMQIDLMKLKIGKVVYKDYSKGGVPSVQEFNVGINEEMKDITDPNSIVQVIVLHSLMKTPVAMLSNFDVKGLQSVVTGTVGTVKDLGLGAVSTATGLGKDAVGTAANTLKKTTEGITDVIKLPFGNKQ